MVKQAVAKRERREVDYLAFNQVVSILLGCIVSRRNLICLAVCREKASTCTHMGWTYKCFHMKVNLCTNNCFNFSGAGYLSNGLNILFNLSLVVFVEIILVFLSFLSFK